MTSAAAPHFLFLTQDFQKREEQPAASLFTPMSMTVVAALLLPLRGGGGSGGVALCGAKDDYYSSLN